MAIVWQSRGKRVAVVTAAAGVGMGNTVFELKVLEKTSRLMRPSQHGMKIYTHVRVAFLLFHSRNCATLVTQVKEPTNGC